jgi:putative transposase
MTTESHQEHRSIRLPGYDYAAPGWYFVTICTWNRQNLFGEIRAGEAQLNPYGEVAQTEWNRLSTRFSFIQLDYFTVMPNHVQGIIVIMGDHPQVVGQARKFGLPVADSLSSIVGSYKSVTARKINILRNAPGLQVWQGNFYEHIIRSQADLKNIREYIHNNPLKWELDRFWNSERMPDR